jgi:hypothetical protein
MKTPEITCDTCGKKLRPAKRRKVYTIDAQSVIVCLDCYRAIADAGEAGRLHPDTETRLYAPERHTLPEAAELLRIPAGTLRQRLSRAMLSDRWRSPTRGRIGRVWYLTLADWRSIPGNKSP